LVVLVVLLVGQAAQGHDWSWGRCPTVDPVKNLALDKFLGLWYVIQQFDTSSSCLTLNYTRVSETQLKVTKARQVYLLDAASIEHTNTYEGTLDIPYADSQGQMRVKWPLNFAGKGDYVVIDTDYDGYAGIYECQRITSLMHRTSATILSRTPYLDVTFIDRIKRRLASFDIDDHDFDQVAHENCISRSDSDLNINLDEKTFKKVITGTVEGVKDIAITTTLAVDEMYDKTTHAVYDGYDKTTDAVDEIFDKTTGAVYEGYDKSKEALSSGVIKTRQTVSVGLHKVADGVRDMADVVESAATGLLPPKQIEDWNVFPQ